MHYVFLGGIMAVGCLVDQTGDAVEQTGSAVEKTGNASVKMALAAGAVYLILKKMKAI